MPLKSGHLTEKEKTFVKHMAMHNDRGYAAHRAGYSQPATSGSKLMANPLVEEATRELARSFLREKAPWISVHGLTTIAMDEKQPAGARVTAYTNLAKLSGIAISEAESEKDLHEMTGPELSAHHARLVRQAEAMAQALAERAKPVIDGQTAQETPSALD